MKQREVTTADNTRWTCVQAYSSGGNDKLEEKAKEQAPAGKVPVVCTPGGGAQSVRLSLAEDWLDNLPDEQLVRLIHDAASS